MGRNVIDLQINIKADQKVSYEEGLEALKKHPDVSKLNIQYLSSINELLDLLDITRAAFERNILENEKIKTGVRHLNVTGSNFPRTRIYIGAVDLIEYLVMYCGLTYWKKEHVGLNRYQLTGYKNKQITNQDIEYLAKTLFEGRLKSTKHIEEEFKRTRRIVSRLTNIMETITFAFPDSQRQLRRFVFAPNENVDQIEDYFSNYKSYENKIVKIIED
ncbi:hypothetical protein IIE26_27165 (plasmid) [Cytobacillus oceanisediminis]|uniref:hypothetical protein n=1 Tax=Cytobacillus oceanisediminis TaxID=665099 RepID=UPI0018640941|nr:hypothetical protein [Cytobacillus oceanisediminis]QOK30051.1 hypothetical protein IIE26_27165 [Cytobacillus oceanisediminis]